MSIKISKLHSLTGHRDSIYTICGGTNPSHLFSGGGDGMVVFWNLESPEHGELIARVPNSIYSIYYLAETERLIAAQNFEGIHLLDVKIKKEIASLKITDTYIFDMQVHGNSLFVACGDGSVVVVDMIKWIIDKQIKSSNQSARAIAIHNNHGELAIGYSDKCIRIFDLEDYQLKQEWQGHDNSVFTLKYSPTNDFLLSGGRDARLRVWDAGNGYEMNHDIVAHMYTINHVAFSPDNKHFVTCSMDKSIKVWDAERFKLLKVIDKARHAGHGTSVNKLSWTSFNNQLVSASDDRTLSVWEIIF